jgi:hypothetical protein
METFSFLNSVHVELTNVHDVWRSEYTTTPSTHNFLFVFQVKVEKRLAIFPLIPYPYYPLRFKPQIHKFPHIVPTFSLPNCPSPSPRLDPPSLPTNPETISEAIGTDHASFDVYYANIKSATDDAAKAAWRNQLAWTVTCHAISAELTMYPAMEKHLGQVGVGLAAKDKEQHLEVFYSLPRSRILASWTDNNVMD